MDRKEGKGSGYIQLRLIELLAGQWKRTRVGRVGPDNNNNCVCAQDEARQKGKRAIWSVNHSN